MTEPDVYDMAAKKRPDGDGGNGPYRGETATPARDSQQDQGSATPDRAITFAELKTAAYNGEFPDEGLAMPDRIMFWAMRDMYQRFKAGQITKEQGEAEKNAASRIYRKDRAKYDDYVKTARHITSLWKSVEAAATNYAKSNGRTPEADALFEAVYNARPK